MPKLNSSKNTKRSYVPDKTEQAKQSVNMKFYNSKAWRTTSKAYRRDHPVCENCMHKGRTKAVNHVDHVISIQQGGHKYHIDNLMSLCINCHSSKTIAEQKQILVKYAGKFGQYIPYDKKQVYDVIK